MKSSHAYLLVDESGGHYFTDFRYLQKAREKIRHLQVWDISENGYGEFLSRRQYDRLYFEKDIPYILYQQLKKTNIPLVPAGDLIQSIRMKKESGELEVLAEAINAVTWAFHSLVEYLRLGVYEGMSEWDVVKFLRRRLDELDWEDFSFSPIVAFDENAAIPHYSYSRSKTLTSKSRQILVDFGFFHKNYASDFTRVIFLRPPTKEMAHCYNILEESFILFEEQFSSMKTTADIDLLFRSIIKEAGYGQYFQHATGHGIGLECHEYPSLSPFSKAEIVNNMVFTIEPGIYLPGKGGIRIEDMYTVKRGNLVKLTSYSREMIVL